MLLRFFKAGLTTAAAAATTAVAADAGVVAPVVFIQAILRCGSSRRSRRGDTLHQAASN